MDETEQIAAPDALWLAALTRDRARAAARLADMLPGRDVGEAARVYRFSSRSTAATGLDRGMVPGM